MIDPAELVNEVARDISAALMRQTQAIDAAVDTDRPVRAAVVVAVLRAYAAVIEDQEIAATDRAVVQKLTTDTTEALRGAMKAAQRK